MSETTESMITTDGTPSRRAVLATLAACGCACAMSSTASAAPEDRAPPAKPAKSDLGPVADFGADGVVDKFARDKQFLVFRKGDTLHASSSLCTHKRCILKKSPDATILKCPCHQSDFDLDGIPMGGPAKTSLIRYGITIENGRVFVDTTKSFDEKDWAAAGASAKVG
jgi:nitrite reductase/ring-hydroxylating ferredoxin subunit